MPEAGYGVSSFFFLGGKATHFRLLHFSAFGRSAISLFFAQSDAVTAIQNSPSSVFSVDASESCRRQTSRDGGKGLGRGRARTCPRVGLKNDWDVGTYTVKRRGIQSYSGSHYGLLTGQYPSAETRGKRKWWDERPSGIDAKETPRETIAFLAFGCQSTPENDLYQEARSRRHGGCYQVVPSGRISLTFFSPLFPVCFFFFPAAGS